MLEISEIGTIVLSMDPPHCGMEPPLIQIAKHQDQLMDMWRTQRVEFITDRDSSR